MTKKFCDLCGQPAIDSDYQLERALEFGEKHSAYRGDSVQRPMERTKILTRAHFAFRDHETGFGGPPDLCGECLVQLLEELVITVRGKYAPEPKSKKK